MALFYLEHDLKEFDPRAQAVEITLKGIIELLNSYDVEKAVAVTALLHVIVNLYNPDLPDDDARVFVERAAEWIQGYFTPVEMYDESGYGSGV